MKKVKFIGKIIYWVNIIFALLLLLSFVLPYMPPKTFGSLTLLSLIVSPLIVINCAFAIYWLVRMRKQFWLSFILLVIAYFHLPPLVEFSAATDASGFNNSLSVLTYNVRLFNAYEDKLDEDVLSSFSEIVKKNNPDVICIQEYYKKTHLSFAEYPYQYIHYRNDEIKLGHAIISKYPLENKGAFNFEKSNNNVIYADVIKDSDTIRVYNLHLQSLGILPSVSYLQEGNTDRIRNRMSATFKKQQQQVKQVLAHKAKTMHPVIMAGDLNNTPYSYTYHTLKGAFTDAFEEQGNGMGTTFKFDGYPMRIDYILSAPEMEVVDFITENRTFSDHYAVGARMAW